VFVDNKWYNTVSGGELFTNGNFSEPLNTGLYSTENGASISIEDGRLKVSGGTTNYPVANYEITGVTLGNKYSVKIGYVSGAEAYTEIGSFLNGNDYAFGAPLEGSKEVTFTAITTSIFIRFIGGLVTDNQSGYFDNISVYAVEEPTLGTEILPTPSFIKNPVYIDNQIPQYIDYSQELATNVMDSTVIDGDLEVSGNLSGMSGFDLGQTWQDVLASRSLDVTYTNTTGKPIMLNISGYQTSYAKIYIQLDGVDFFVAEGGSNNGYNDYATCFFIVPAGSKYKVLGSGYSSIISGLVLWNELR